MALSLITEPAIEPLSTDEVKKQCRIEVPDDDAYIKDFLIPALRERAEIATWRQLITATWELKLDQFPTVFIDVPKPPLLSVTSITYVDTNGTTQTWTASKYQVDAPNGPRCARGRIQPAYGESWPTTRGQLNAVVVKFTNGYGAAGTNVPPLLRMAMLLDAGTLYEFREDVISGMIVTPLPRASANIYRSFKSHPVTR